MQKVVGSSPIIRSNESPGNGAFLLPDVARYLAGQGESQVPVRFGTPQRTRNESAATASPRLVTIRRMTVDDILAADMDATDTVDRALDALNDLERRDLNELYESRALLRLITAQGALHNAEVAIARVCR
jgi:hypothetical protein